jgi:hypothetical protein
LACFDGCTVILMLVLRGFKTLKLVDSAKFTIFALELIWRHQRTHPRRSASASSVAAACTRWQASRTSAKYAACLLFLTCRPRTGPAGACPGMVSKSPRAHLQVAVSTPFGAPSDNYIIGTLKSCPGVELVFLPRFVCLLAFVAVLLLMCGFLLALFSQPRPRAPCQPKRNQLPRKHLWHEGAAQFGFFVCCDSPGSASSLSA